MMAEKLRKKFPLTVIRPSNAYIYTHNPPAPPQKKKSISDKIKQRIMGVFIWWAHLCDINLYAIRGKAHKSISLDVQKIFPNISWMMGLWREGVVVVRERKDPGKVIRWEPPNLCDLPIHIVGCGEVGRLLFLTARGRMSPALMKLWRPFCCL